MAVSGASSGLQVSAFGGVAVLDRSQIVSVSCKASLQLSCQSVWEAAVDCWADRGTGAAAAPVNSSCLLCAKPHLHGGCQLNVPSKGTRKPILCFTAICHNLRICLCACVCVCVCWFFVWWVYLQYRGSIHSICQAGMLLDWHRLSQ